MIYQDNKRDMDNQVALAEYLASFWNPEGVKKAQEIRNSRSKHNFKSDKDFEEEIVSGKYKQNPLLEAIIKARELEKQERRQVEKTNNRAPRSKLPTDLSVIKSTIGKFK